MAKKRDVRDAIIASLSFMLADAYEELAEGRPWATVNFGLYDDDETIYGGSSFALEADGEEFVITVSKPRKRKE